MAETHEERIERIAREDREHRAQLLRDALTEFTRAAEGPAKFPHLNPPDESLGFDGMGVKVKANGRNVVEAVILIACVGFLAYMIRDHDMRNVERAASVVAASKEIAQRQAEVKESMAEVVYVLTLDEKDRKALRMDMPESLRKRRER